MENETIADIVAEKRARANEIECAACRNPNQFQRELIHDLRTEADRIDAAWKREYDTLNSEREKCRLYGLHEHEKVLKLMAQLKAVGNAAAMREAVEAVVRALSESNDVQSALLLMQAEEKCNAALAVPTRNCDMMPNIEDLTMHDLAKSPCKSTLVCASREELLALVRWLLAPADERKGEGDGE